ncbi:hypothetical protein V1514DRAFT_105879 [Lipomyces japonicus]|uniref:uncharacterized protein n=1 Tax=Lipomyces japonicus TaxID=56871 RepID=UPI0034CF4940
MGTSDDPWSDDWTPSSNASSSSLPASKVSPGVVILNNKDQLQKLFGKETSSSSPSSSSSAAATAAAATTTTTTRSTSQSGPIPHVDVQTSSQGSSYRPQLRILKRQPATASDHDLARSGTNNNNTRNDRPDHQIRPGESEHDRRERFRREKEAKYKAARESLFGPDQVPGMTSNNYDNNNTVIYNNNNNNNSGQQVKRDRLKKQVTSKSPRSKSGSNSPLSNGIIRSPKGPDGTAGFTKK